MSIHTILGSGGIIAEELTKELIDNKLPVRLVARHPRYHQGATVLAADMTDPAGAMEAIRGSAVVYLCIGLKYDFRIWRKQWPAIFENTIAACRETQAKLIFFDNVYMYGAVDGPMTEELPYEPCSRKGDLRARLATQLMSEVRKGNIVASIARSADFYGPGADRTSVLNLLVFQRLLKGQKAQWMVNPRAKHSFTYTKDAAKALYILASDENSWNQLWHLPTAAPPLTGAAYIDMAAEALGKTPRSMVLPKWMIRTAGLLDRTLAELYEMLYQYEFDYWFDSSKFGKAYHFQPTSYAEGIKATADAYRDGIGL